MLDGKTVLITGGTGSFGRKLVATVPKRHRRRRLIVLSRDEVKQQAMDRHTLEYDDYFATLPPPATLQFHREPDPEGGRPCPAGFRYSSDTNDRWLSVEELRRVVKRSLPRGRRAAGGARPPRAETITSPCSLPEPELADGRS